MPLIRSSGGAQRAFLIAAAAFLLVAPYPSSAGWRVFFILVGAIALAWRSYATGEGLGLSRVPRPFVIAVLAWAGLCTASLAWSVNPGYTLQELRRELLYGALAFVVFFCGTRSPREVHLWVRVILVG